MTNKPTIKIFEDRKVRSVWDAEAGKWYISIVDVISYSYNEVISGSYSFAVRTTDSETKPEILRLRDLPLTVCLSVKGSRYPAHLHFLLQYFVHVGRAFDIKPGRRIGEPDESLRIVEQGNASVTDSSSSSIRQETMSLMIPSMRYWIFFSFIGLRGIGRRVPSEKDIAKKPSCSVVQQPASAGR